ncbi:hypothetical protein QBC38DRAFT_468464 [Podospora fimiseda]|uniref:Uncharacterized protein n=1 Tax=Podospora fimiseda TaxID=252190 RepID=A0AAN7BW18_9PEZI|nr:hypothetical protein QBC38DRAFT_468464 [Podospora fimiseda]
MFLPVLCLCTLPVPVWVSGVEAPIVKVLASHLPSAQSKSKECEMKINFADKKTNFDIFIPDAGPALSDSSFVYAQHKH